MRGRPPVAGLRAVVVAMMLAALPSGAVLAEQIRPNLPGAGAKPKAVHKARRFRPTLPQRNPTRVSADITATIKVDGTSSPLSADGAAASGMAGASASASVAVAGADIPQQRPIEVAAAEPASEPEITAALSPADAEPVEDSADDAGEDQAGAESDDTPSDETEEVAATETTAAAAEGEPAEKTSALADSAPSDETPPESADAGEEPASEAGKPEPVNATASEDETPEETDALAKPADVVADAGDAEASADDAAADEADEPSPPKETARLEAEPSPPKEIARLEAEPEQAKPEAAEPEEAKPEETKPEPAADAVEAEQSAEPEPEPEAEPEVVEAEPVETVVPSHDAIVVLEVLPPPADIAAAPAPAKPEAPADDAAPMEMAAVTPPSEPAPEPAIPAVNDTPADADAEDVPSEAAVDSDEAELTEPTEAAETSPAETSPDATLPDATPPAETASEPASGDAAATPATPEEDAAAPSDAAVEDAAVEVVPPPPPAHPVVAAIRAKLADPGFRDGFNAATLEGLEAFYGAREGPPLWITDSGFSPKAKALIAEIGNADDWGLDARDFDAPKADARASTEEEQAVAELDLAMAVLKYARYAQGGARSPSSFSPLFDQKPEQRGTETLLTEIAGASDPATYLTSLHPQHEQFKRLRAALVKARDRAAAAGRNPRNDGEVQLLVINMERWRWLPRNLGSYHVWNNVPEFNVRVMKNGKPIYVEKTIVGQDKYATPFFSAPMRNIVFHPNWTVPPTIVKEDLAPKLQAPRGIFSPSKTDMLRGYGLSVSYKGEPVDADRVDWANVNIHTYTFTQDPGPTNVLGKFKFNFPNRHAIYMHDTVQPELFSERVRTLSHGCIRVHEPDRFAALLLAQDKGWSYAQIQRLVAKNSSTVIGLNHKVPVHLTYFTATIDENGGLNRFADIYGIDNRMAAKLFENPARFPVPSTPAVVEQSRDQDRSARRRGGGGGLDDLISGLFGN